MTQAVVNVTTGRNATIRAIFIFVAIKCLTSQTFKLPPPEVRYSVLGHIQSIGSQQKVVIGVFPMKQDPTLPLSGVSGVEVLLIKTAPSDMVQAAISRQPNYIRHGVSFQPGANPWGKLRR